MLVADENRNNPTKQIEIILANGYERYLQENFENADARIEDLRGLASYANRYTSTEEFLSELALISTSVSKSRSRSSAKRSSRAARTTNC